MSETLAYLAGIFDGEGSIGYHSSGAGARKQFVMTVKMTDRAVLEMLREEFGGCIMFRPREKPHWQDQWQWRIKSRWAVRAYWRMEPYLRIKRYPVD